MAFMGTRVAHAGVLNAAFGLLLVGTGGCPTSASSNAALGQAGVDLGLLVIGPVIDGLIPDDVNLLEKAPRWYLLSPKENVSSDPLLTFKPVGVVEPEKKKRVVVLFSISNGHDGPLLLGNEAVTLLDADDQPVPLLKRAETAIAPGATRKIAYTFSTKGAARGVWDLNIRFADETVVGPVLFQKKRP